MHNYFLPYFYPSDIESYFHGFIMGCSLCAFFAFILWISEFLEPKSRISIPKPAATMEEAMAEIKREIEMATPGSPFTLTGLPETRWPEFAVSPFAAARDSKGRFIKSVK